MLERGEDVLPAIDGRLCISNDVSVAAAFISTSPSISISISSCCRRLPLSILSPFVRRGDAAAFAAFDVALPLPPCALLGSDLGDAFTVRARGEGDGRTGAAMGGSLGLCIVRACLVGGGARMDVYRLGPCGAFHSPDAPSRPVLLVIEDEGVCTRGEAIEAGGAMFLGPAPRFPLPGPAALWPPRGVVAGLL